ncbi:MAG: PBP1A family penicillin-binding protein [Pseudomonadota bacterium]
MRFTRRRDEGGPTASRERPRGAANESDQAPGGLLDWSPRGRGRAAGASTGGPPRFETAGAKRPARSWAARALQAVVDRISRFFVGAAVLLAAMGLWVGVVVSAATWEKLRLMPESAALMDGRQRGSVTVLDANGELLGVRGQRLERITVDDASRPLIDAVLSAEDRRFYWHLGLDPIGLARALLVNYRLGYTAQGGSTITQQVAKLAFLSQDRTISRKLEEVPWALALELAYTKDEILSIYLNRAYLGSASFGFEAAAQRYFDVSARKVSPAQAALLAGLLRAPSRWSPEADFTAAQERANVVLGAMRDARVLSDRDRRTAEQEVAAMQPRTPTEFAPHFVDWIADERVPARLAPLSRDHLGGEPDQIDVVVKTTLDRNAQRLAEKAIDEAFATHEKAARNGDAEAAAVVLSTDGAVRAMVGGRGYGDSVFNRATQAARQVGSAFKPVVYAAAIERGLRPNAGVDDRPVRLGRWRPKNYAGRYRGWITLEHALTVSSNMAAVRLMMRVGPKRVVEMAERLGYATSGVTPYPSVALGAFEASPLEVAGAYAVFARRGAETPPYAIEEIRTPEDRLLWEKPIDEGAQTIRTSTAGWITTMMRSVVERGTGRRARLPDFRPVAGKTGTTQESRDVWFAGFTGDYVGVVWIGKDDNTELRGKVVGGNFPADIWREIMTPLHEGLRFAALPDRAIPGGVRHASVEELEAAAKAREEAKAAALAEGLTETAAIAAGDAAAYRVAPRLKPRSDPAESRPLVTTKKKKARPLYVPPRRGQSSAARTRQRDQRTYRSLRRERMDR